MSQIPDPGQALAQMIGGYWITQGIHVVAELGIADLLSSGPQTAAELAPRCGAQHDALYRILRATASVGIFAEDLHGRFTLTPLGEFLRSDAPASHRSFARIMGGELYQAWGKLLPSVRTGTQAFRQAFGKPFFEHMSSHPERHRIYDEAMNGVHGPETEPVLDAYDLSRFRLIVDVGGGNGDALCTMLRRHPVLQGILFELPPVAERAAERITDAGLGDRCKAVGGDFFAAVPAGADAYILRHVIHDWEDSEAVGILRTCRKAMPPGGRILVVESVIPPGNGPCFGKWLDLMMLVVGGRERTEEQYRRLFSDAGLTLSRIIPTAHEVSILEGIR